MNQYGWSGRPLVVVEMRRKKRWDYFALTGSHRTAAARKSGIKVPVVILPFQFFKESKCVDDFFYFYNIYADAYDFIHGLKCEIPWKKYPKDIVKLLARDMRSITPA
jgi:hypothetical protein